ncbi:unnamed protein product, partial [Sphacelaria rigidula]
GLLCGEGFALAHQLAILCLRQLYHSSPQLPGRLQHKLMTVVVERSPYYLPTHVFYAELSRNVQCHSIPTLPLLTNHTVVTIIITDPIKFDFGNDRLLSNAETILRFVT